MSRVQFRDPKRTGESRNFPCDFSIFMNPGVTIVAQSVAIVVYSGIDPAPATMLNGAPSHSGTIVNQSLTGGVAGVLYEILYSATLSDGQTPELAGFIYVEPDLP